MKILKRPILTTLLFGFVSGISFIPLNRVLNTMFLRPESICLTLWLLIGGYAILLCLWSQTRIRPILYPLLMLFMAAFVVPSVAVFFSLALAIVSWIRSGLCFQEPGVIKWGVEITLCSSGILLLAAFGPGPAGGWALSVWMFFLLQSIYALIFYPAAISLKGQHEIDPFERASRRAKDILSTAGFP
jgi:hypothetical protein